MHWKAIVNKAGETVPCPGCQEPLLLSPWGPVCPKALEDRVQKVEGKKLLYHYHVALYGLHQNPGKCGSEGCYQSCNALN